VLCLSRSALSLGHLLLTAELGDRQGEALLFLDD